jgi:hypothetical protein
MSLEDSKSQAGVIEDIQKLPAGVFQEPWVLASPRLGLFKKSALFRWFFYGILAQVIIARLSAAHCCTADSGRQ